MLSVVIVTLNEEDKIRDCLESVKWADEIIVVDSFSTDRTVEIAKEYTSKVYQQEYLGGGPMRNLGIAKTKGDWIFTIDADERLTPELRAEIQQSLRSPECDGYYVPRKAYFMGKWIKHCGWWPDYVLRLFKKDAGTYDHSLAHAKVAVRGKTGKLQNPLLHYTCRDVREFLDKINSRTSLMAKNARHATPLATGLLHAWARFFKLYFLQAGFMDGKEGLIISIVASYYVFIKYIKLWERQKEGV